MKSTTTPPTDELSDSTRDLVLKTDIANLLKKVKSGRPLTASERKLIEAQQPASPPGSLDWPQAFDSLKACASRTGVPVGVLRSAKAAGCPAFRSTRVYFAEFLRWHFEARPETDAPDFAVEKARLTRAQAVAQERDNAIQEGTLHTLAQVEEALWHGEHGLAAVRAAWLEFPRTTGLKIRSIMSGAGIATNIIDQVVSEAVNGITAPLEALRAAQPKGEQNE